MRREFIVCDLCKKETNVSVFVVDPSLKVVDACLSCKERWVAAVQPVFNPKDQIAPNEWQVIATPQLVQANRRVDGKLEQLDYRPKSKMIWDSKTLNWYPIEQPYGEQLFDRLYEIIRLKEKERHADKSAEKLEDKNWHAYLAIVWPKKAKRPAKRPAKIHDCTMECSRCGAVQLIADTTPKQMYWMLKRFHSDHQRCHEIVVDED